MRILHEIIAEGKKELIRIPNTKFLLTGFGKDTNGNSVIKLKNEFNGNGFSIQINSGQLQKTFSLKKEKKPSELDSKDLATISKEIVKYVKEFGSDKQKTGLK